MKTKLKIYHLLLFLAICNLTIAQEQKLTQSIARINLINPALEYEHPISKTSIATARVGWGLSGDYPNLDTGFGTGWVYMLVPFANLEYKWLYDIDKRAKEGKNTQYNSGNYFGLRTEYRGKATKTNISRTENNDYSIGPMWGMQRSFGKLHLLFDLGGIYYFDATGNDGIFYSLHLRLGLNMSKSR